MSSSNEEMYRPEFQAHDDPCKARLAGNKYVKFFCLAGIVIFWTLEADAFQRAGLMYPNIPAIRLVSSLGYVIIGVTSYMITPTFPYKQYYQSTGVIGALLYLAQILWVFSLTKLSLAINATLTQTSVVFVYTVSICLGLNTLNQRTIIALVLCITGVYFVSDTSDEVISTTMGFIAALINAALYGLIEVPSTLKIRYRHLSNQGI